MEVIIKLMNHTQEEDQEEDNSIKKMRKDN